MSSKVFALMNKPALHRHLSQRAGASMGACALLVLLQAAAFSSPSFANADAPPQPSNAGAAPEAGKPLEMPSSEQLAYILRNTLERVDYGNKTGNYQGLYAVLTPQVQQKVDLQKLADAMGGFRKLNVDMAPVQKIEPQYDRPPQLSPEGLLTLHGGFSMQPRPIRFDLSYVRSDGAWRLQVLNLDAPPIQPVAAAGKTPPPQPSPQATGAQPTLQVAQAPASTASPPAATQGAPKPAASISPYLDTSTDPPTASKW